jgi:hypothetical protein
MTEAEWLACDDRGKMLQCLRQLGTDRRIVCHLAGKVMLRKVQLFLCGCCRLRWEELSDQRSRIAVEVAERHADGLAKQPDLRKARQGAEEATRGGWGGSSIPYLAAEATKVAGEQAWNAAWIAAAITPILLLRCVFGNPFRQLVLKPAWLTSAVQTLARAAYDERDLPSGPLDTARLAVLSDALEEAGCSEDAILSHLRSPGPHIRGCWALDLVLGKG